MTERLPISAIVVSRNEGGLLARCLPTIAFCDEILVVDLESTDETAAVAEAHGATVVPHRAEPTVERVRAAVLSRVRHDWVLTTDPDEELPQALQAEIAETFASLPPDVAVVFAPIRYHFQGRPLRGTTWGGERHRRLLVRRSAVEPSRTIYSGVSVHAGFRSIELPFSPATAIVHHWSPSYRSLVAKHRRYVSASAEDRVRAGEITGWRRIAETPWRAFAESYFERRGYLDGVTGLVLSLFWAWFSTSSELALKRRLRARIHAA